ncbi:MAG TPA: hypothetical protein VM933_06790 [Acidimicrobiales bacterium]|nr:hypothetical protein [Acidimicrobiales bacterium]
MRDRSAAEWFTFTVAALVVAAVIGLIAVEIPGSKRPPAPTATTGEVEERTGRFVVPVDVRNRGEATAAEVQVIATLVVDGQEAEADQVVDFLSGGEVEELEFVFDDDPRDGDLEVRIAGYQLP